MKNLINQYLEYTGYSLNNKDLWDLTLYIFFDALFFLFLLILLLSIFYFLLKEFFNKKSFFKSFTFIAIIVFIVFLDYSLGFEENKKQLNYFFYRLVNNSIYSVISQFFFPVFLIVLLYYLVKANQKNKTYRLFIFISLFLHLAVFGKYFDLTPIVPSPPDPIYNDPNAEYGKSIQVKNRDKKNQPGKRLAQSNLKRDQGVIMLDQLPKELKFPSRAINNNEKDQVKSQSQTEKKKLKKKKKTRKIVQAKKRKQKRKKVETSEFMEYSYEKPNNDNQEENQKSIVPQAENENLVINDEKIKKELASGITPKQKKELVMEESPFQKYENNESVTKPIKAKVNPGKQYEGTVLESEKEKQIVPRTKSKLVMEESDFQEFEDSNRNNSNKNKVMPKAKNNSYTVFNNKNQKSKIIIPSEKKKLVMEEEFKKYQDERKRNKIEKTLEVENKAKILNKKKEVIFEPQVPQKKSLVIPEEKEITKKIDPISKQSSEKEKSVEKELKKLKDIHKEMDKNKKTVEEEKSNPADKMVNKNISDHKQAEENKKDIDQKESADKQLSQNQKESKEKEKKKKVKYSNLFKDLNKKVKKRESIVKPAVEPDKDDIDEDRPWRKYIKEKSEDKDDDEYSKSTWHNKLKKGELKPYRKVNPKDFYFGDDDRNGWSDFTMDMDLGSDNSTGKLSIKGLDEFNHKSYMQDLVTSIGSEWFYKYCPLQQILLDVMKPSTPIIVHFQINKEGKIESYRLLQKGNIKIQNQAVIKAFQRFKGLKPPKQFEYRNLRMKFVITKPYEVRGTNVRMITGKVFLSGQVKKKEK